MANNTIQIKRTTVSGRTPNTTNSSNASFIDAGVLAINLADSKLFTANTANGLIELGSNQTNLSVTSILNVGGVSYRGTANATTTSTSPVTVVSANASVYGSMDVVIQGTSAGERHITKLTATSNSSVVSSTEYATILTGATLFTVDTDLTSGNMRVVITPSGATSTTFRVSYELLLA